MNLFKKSSSETPPNEQNLASFEHAMSLCEFCPKLCRHSCPVTNAIPNEPLIPQAKMSTLQSMNRNLTAWNEEQVSTLYACTGCKRCQTYCKHENDVASTLWAGRASAVSRGVTHPALRTFPQDFQTRSEKRFATLRATVPMEYRATEGRVGYLPGCDAIDHNTDELFDAMTIFGHLKINYVRFVDHAAQCAGYPLWASGHIQAARFAAEEFLRAIRKFSTVVMGCAMCTHLVKNIFPQEGFDHNVEVLHVTEFLTTHAARIVPQRKLSQAFYHDACSLSRHLNQVETPRRLLKISVENIQELFHAREFSECCGGGGLVPITHPEVPRYQSSQILNEVKLFGGDLLVTADPTCQCALQSHPSDDVRVQSLLNVLAWSVRT